MTLPPGCTPEQAAEAIYDEMPCVNSAEDCRILADGLRAYDAAQWVRPKDGLPAEGVEVLFLMERNGPFYFGEYRNETFFDNTLGLQCPSCFVFAWRMPQPPEGEK
jgi:guanyl-specific ribonuclease Sa